MVSDGLKSFIGVRGEVDIRLIGSTIEKGNRQISNDISENTFFSSRIIRIETAEMQYDLTVNMLIEHQ